METKSAALELDVYVTELKKKVRSWESCNNEMVNLMAMIISKANTENDESIVTEKEHYLKKVHFIAQRNDHIIVSAPSVTDPSNHPYFKAPLIFIPGAISQLQHMASGHRSQQYIFP